MKILLINPPVPLTYYNREFYPSLSMLYLGSVLKKNGEEVKILDFNTIKLGDSVNPQKIYEDILVDTVSTFQPALIGCGCLFSGNFPDVLKFSTLCKNRFKNIPIVIGGIHPTLYPYEILTNCSFIDWIIMGEGEDTIVQLVKTIKSNRSDFDKIEGFAYRKNGKIFANPKTHFIENLDSIPFPAYELINLKDYYVDTSNWYNPKKFPINTSLPIITSRSCPNRCTFCSMYKVMGPGWRARSPKNVVDEIEYLYNKYNHRHFSIMDDNFTLSKSHALEICNQIIKRKLNIQFETPNGVAVTTLDKELLDAMVSAGLVRISLAIESGSDFIRNQIMLKHLSSKKIYEIARLTKKYKQLYVKAFFIIGLPEETKETLADTYDMIKKINVDRAHVSNIVPFPGTKLFKQALRDNLLVDIDPNDLYKSEEFYSTNRNRFFIKPYNMDLRDLYEFRAKFEDLITKQRRKNEILRKKSNNLRS